MPLIYVRGGVLHGQEEDRVVPGDLRVPCRAILRAIAVLPVRDDLPASPRLRRRMRVEYRMQDRQLLLACHALGCSERPPHVQSDVYEE